MTNEEIARRIKEIRKEKNLTQNDIAQYLNKTAATVSDIERGKIQVSAADLYTLARALNKPIEYFYGEVYDSKEIDDLLAIIRRQSPEQQQKIIQQTKMLLSLQSIQDKSITTGKELSNDEIMAAINAVLSYAAEIEAIYLQTREIKNNLLDAFKSHGIEENSIINS